MPLRSGVAPNRGDKPCLPGKFGWEDRPPGLGWTDEDYNDIRLVMECPQEGLLGDGIIRLVG